MNLLSEYKKSSIMCNYIFTELIATTMEHFTQMFHFSSLLVDESELEPEVELDKSLLGSNEQ